MLFGRLEAAPEFRCELSDLPFPVAASSQIFRCIDHVPVLPGDWQQNFVDCHLGVSRHFVAHREAPLVSHILGCLNRPQPRQATAVHLGLVRSLVCDGNRGFNIDIHLCVLDVLFSKAERTHRAARYPPVAAGNSNGDYVFTLTPPLLRLVLPIFSVVGFRDWGLGIPTKSGSRPVYRTRSPLESHVLRSTSRPGRRLRGVRGCRGCLGRVFVSFLCRSR